MGRIVTRLQPQGLIQLDRANPYADKFWLPSGNQFYAAHDGTILTRGTGTALITPSPRGQALKGDGNTYFTVPTLNLTAPYSISVLASAPASGNAAMAIGDVTGTGNFLWVNDGTTARWRINGGDISFANSAYTTQAVYTLTVDALGICSVYKDGKFLTSSFNATPTFKITSIGTGYSSASFNMSGGFVTGVQVNSRRALSASEVKDVSDSFWAALQPSASRKIGQTLFSSNSPTVVASTLGVVADVGLTATVLSALNISCTVATVADVGLSASVAAGTISITNTVSRVWKLLTATTGSIPISVSWVGNPTSIEARFNGGSWQTIIASPVGTTGTGTLTGQTYGQGQLDVRFTNDTGVSTYALMVGVGLVIATAGQSNNVGHNTQYNLVPTHATLVAQEWGVDGTWRTLYETVANPYSTRANGVQCSAMNQSVVDGEGSYIGGLATLIMATGMPVAFVPCAVGSTTINSWLPGVSHTNPATIYGSMITRINSVDGVNFVLFYQGESDTATSTASYIADYNTVISAIYADVGVPTVVTVVNSQGGWTTPSNVYPVQQSQRYVSATNAHALPGPEMDGAWTTGGVHYTTTVSAQEVANRAFKVVSAQYLGGTVVTCGCATVSDVGLSAAVNTLVISCSVGTLTLVGNSAQVGVSTNVTSALGVISDVGLSASIQVSTIVTAVTASIDDVGLFSTVLSATSVSCSIGNVLDVGLNADIPVPSAITCGVAGISIVGLPASIPYTIDCSLGLVSLVGIDATVITGLTVSCSANDIIYTGLVAAVTGTTAAYILSASRTVRVLNSSRTSRTG